MRSVTRALVLVPLLLGVGACTSARTRLRTSIRPASVERIAPPIPLGAIDVGFASGGKRIHVSWIDRNERTLRTASFDGTSWSAPETIADAVDLDAAAGRKPVIGVRDDGTGTGTVTRVAHWFDRRNGAETRTAYFAHSTDGETWSPPVALPDGIAEGFGPLGWADVGLPPSAAWIAPWKQPMRPVADALFVAIPDVADRTKMQTGVIAPRVSTTAGVETMTLGPGFYVHYLVETRVKDPGFLVAFRKLGGVNSAYWDKAFIEVVWVPSDGRSLVVFTGGGDRLEEDTRSARPALVRVGTIPWIAYYTPSAGGEIRMFPLLVQPLLARMPSGIRGRKFLCIDRVADFRLDEVDGSIGVATIEGGHLLLRRTASIERLTEAPLAPGSRIEWFGHLGDRRYIAWVEHPGRLVFGAIPPLPDRPAAEASAGDGQPPVTPE